MIRILLGILKLKQPALQDLSLQIISIVGGQLQQLFPNISNQLFPILQERIKSGTPRGKMNILIDSVYDDDGSVVK